MRAFLYCCMISLALAAPALAQKPRAAAAAPSMTVQVTDREGNLLGDVSVALAGPVDRSGSTGESGGIVFRTLRPGTYRLRFERDGFVTLEREVAVRAGAPAEVTVALTPAPEDERSPEDPAAAAPAPPPVVPEARTVDPRLVSIPDYLDKNLIGNEPQRLALLACAEGGTARLLQIREPLPDQLHGEVDEILYVVAGAGVIRIRNQETKIGPGYFGLVPRGVPHSLRRDGRNPLIALSILAGSRCTDGEGAIR